MVGDVTFEDGKGIGSMGSATRHGCGRQSRRSRSEKLDKRPKEGNRRGDQVHPLRV